MKRSAPCEKSRGLQRRSQLAGSRTQRKEAQFPSGPLRAAFRLVNEELLPARFCSWWQWTCYAGKARLGGIYHFMIYSSTAR